jgi:hypothetical protein
MFSVSKASSPILNAALEPFFELFPDHYPHLIRESADEWVIGLDWSEDKGWYVDPQLSRQAASVLECTLKDVATFVETEYVDRVPIVFSMFHSRALLAPALAKSGNGISHLDAIVHIDAHDDLMGAFLKARNNQWLGTTSNKVLEVDAKGSIEFAIREGTVHKGNFLTCYLLQKPAGTVLHVYESLQSSSCYLAPQETIFKCGDHVIPGVVLAATDSRAASSWRLVETPDLPMNLRGNSVWLDVDLDSFCNRFDGDSNRSQMVGSMEERTIMYDRVQCFLKSLAIAPWRRRIQAVSIAASPMFFPSEYWVEVIPIIRNGIRKVLESR